MKNTIKCPKCKTEIEITDALSSEIQEETELKLRKKIENEIELKLKDKENEIGELQSKNKLRDNELLELNKKVRELKEKEASQELEIQKQIFAEKEKAKIEALKIADEEHRLKDLENQKQNAELKKQINEMKRKMEQGSQQTQGEVLELDIETSLKNQFPADQIEEVKKGVRGADVLQIVKTPMGNTAGKILWEIKRTKNWEEKWIDKLKTDQRTEKAEIAALVTEMMPKNIQKEIINIEKVWVCLPKHFLHMASLLREQLLAVAKQKAISAQSENAGQELFSYITSHQFTQQMEAMIESYLGLQEQIIKEKMAFEKQWKHREIQLEKMYKSLFNIYGGITGVTGNALPQIKGLDLLEDPEQKQAGLL